MGLAGQELAGAKREDKPTADRVKYLWHFLGQSGGLPPAANLFGLLR